VSGRARIAVRELRNGPRLLDAAASRHLAVVLRLRAGDAFVAFDPERGVEADAVVARVERGRVHAELGEPRAARAMAPVIWMQGLAKGEKMDAIVRDATELGATRIVPVSSAFAVVRLDGARAEARRKRWMKIAEEAARQCGRADPPKVDAPRVWAEALSIAASAPTRFCLYERATLPLGPRLMKALENRTPMAFAAGPEGGWAEEEVVEAVGAGFEVVSLGELILRTETVASAVLGAARIFLAR
jgi:16S rRNA (uracil1498-N3)-methyltransferase